MCANWLPEPKALFLLGHRTLTNQTILHPRTKTKKNAQILVIQA
jgi:hypothetical protein